MTAENGNGGPPKYRPSDDVKRSQKILEQIEERRLERARVLADKLRREVEFKRADEVGLAEFQNMAAAIQAEANRKITALRKEYDDSVESRAVDLRLREGQIEKLDASLEQLRKQLAAELGKLDAALACGKEGA